MRIDFRLMIPLLLSVLLLFSCNKDLISQAGEVREEWISFKQKVQQAKEDLRMAALELKVLRSENFVSKDTEKYVNDVKERINRIRTLKEDFEELVKSVDFYFAFAYRKANQTKDPNLRSRYLQYISRRKNDFVILLRKAHARIETLDELAVKLQDILNGIEIAAAMRIVSEKINEMESLIAKMDKEIQETERLIEQGYSILEMELG